MKTRRTAWWQYVIGAVLGLLAGIGLASYGESSGLSLIGAPRIVTGLLAVLGVIVLILALQVHKYANTDPKKRPHSFINPTIAVYTLVLAKALGLAGATLAGWYGGQIVVSLSHIEADFYAHAVTERANQHVLQYAQAVHQVELLEDVAGVGAAFADIAGQAAFALDCAAQQLDMATGRFIAGNQTA